MRKKWRADDELRYRETHQEDLGGSESRFIFIVLLLNFQCSLLIFDVVN